jgi:hypothetical protein
LRIPGSLSLSLSLSLLRWRREREERSGGVRPWSGPTTPAYPIGRTRTFTPRSDLPPPLHHIGRTRTLSTPADVNKVPSAQYGVTPPVPLPSTCHTGHAGGSRPPSVRPIACSAAGSPAIARAILERPKFSFIFSGPPSDAWRTVHHRRSGRERTRVLAPPHA